MYIQKEIATEFDRKQLTLAPSSVTERHTFKETESVLNYAESFLSLSAYLDGKMINRCIGIFVGIDAFKNSAIILTSTWLFCTKKPLYDWTEMEYATEAKAFQLVYVPRRMILQRVSNALQLKINSIVTTVREQHQLNSCINMNIPSGVPSALLIERKCIQP